MEMIGFNLIMVLCTHCQKKQKKCSCEERALKTFKKIKGSNIIEVQLVDGRLFLHMYKLKNNHVWYLLIDFSLPYWAWIMTENEYKDATRVGDRQLEVVGPVKQVDYCPTLTPRSILIIVRNSGYDRCFRFIGSIIEIDPDQYSALVRTDALDEW